MDGRPDYVWYVAYGSNLSRRRLQDRLDQGRDPAPPRADRPLVISHELYFAGESAIWTGGRAYVDHRSRPGVRTLARAWLLGYRQWSDLLASESSRETDDQSDCTPTTGQVQALGTGRYDLVLGLGQRAGLPMLTFTSPDPMDPSKCTSPAAAYLATIARGLGEAHGLRAVEAARYLLRRRGVAGSWRAADLLTVLGRLEVA